MSSSAGPTPSADDGAAHKRRKANDGGSAEVVILDAKTRPVGKEITSFGVYYPSFARFIFGACGSTGAIKALLCNSLDAGATVISLRDVTEQDKCPIPGTHWVIHDNGEGCSSTTFEKGLFYLGSPGRRPLGRYGTGMQTGSMHIAPACLVVSRHLSAPGATLVALLTADRTTERHTTYGVWTQIDDDDAKQKENGFFDAIAKETSTPPSQLLAFVRNAMLAPRGTALFLLNVYSATSKRQADLKASLSFLRMPLQDSRFAHVSISVFGDEQKATASGLAVSVPAKDLPPPLQPRDAKETSYTACVMDAPPGQDSCIRWYWNGIFVTQTAVPGPMERRRVMCVSIDPWDTTRDDDNKGKGCSVNPDKCDILTSKDWLELQSKAAHVLCARF